MKKVLDLFKFLCYTLIALIVGFFVGDELCQRIERMQLRATCYQSQAAQLPMMNDYLDFRIKQICRINIP